MVQDYTCKEWRLYILIILFSGNPINRDTLSRVYEWEQYYLYVLIILFGDNFKHSDMTSMSDQIMK